MARKRRFEQLQAAAATPREKKIYVNPLQERVDHKLEDVGKSLEGKGKTILYGLGAILVISILIFLFMRWNRGSDAAAQLALGKAIETSQLQVTDTPPPDSTVRTFKTEKERAEAAIAEFQAVADKFGGDVGEKARYFIATNRLMVDRPAAIAELEALASADTPTGKMAKFALAQTRVDDGRLDEAVTIYQGLLALENSLVARDTINYELAQIYQKQGKTTEAADIYFNIAKAASEAKDRDGKPVRMTETATEAKKKLAEIDPERAKLIEEPAPASPFGAGGPPINIQ
jgi:tetratricopeptide (TPR) repeat protein